MRISLQRKSNLPAKRAESGLRERWQQCSQPDGKPVGECRQPRNSCSECEHEWMQEEQVRLPLRSTSGPPTAAIRSRTRIFEIGKWGASSRKGIRPFAFFLGSHPANFAVAGGGSDRILPPK